MLEIILVCVVFLMIAVIAMVASLKKDLVAIHDQLVSVQSQLLLIQKQTKEDPFYNPRATQEAEDKLFKNSIAKITDITNSKVSELYEYFASDIKKNRTQKIAKQKAESGLCIRFLCMNNISPRNKFYCSQKCRVLNKYEK